MSCRSSHVIKLKLSSQLIGQFGHVTASASCKQPEKGECKSWTLDSGLDHGLDYGLEYGLNFRLIGLGPGAMFGLGTAQESLQQQLADLKGNLALLL